MLTDKEREELRQRNIAERAEGAKAEIAQNGPSSDQRKFALAEALREREYARKEHAVGQYDDEPVMQSINVFPATSSMGEPRKYLVVTTKRGRVFERLMGDPKASWVEIAPPIPGCRARETYNNVRIADGDVVEAQS